MTSRGPNFAPLQASPGWQCALDHPFTAVLRRLTSGRSCHMVGGALRDHALGLAARDYDAVVAGTGLEIAEGLAQARNGRLVSLGGDRFAAYRVVTPEGTVDIWDRGSQPLNEDLHRRDFTIHSFALDVHSGRLIDPFDGLPDLERRILRATSETTFTADPLRLLRLTRFAAQLPEFETDQATIELARAAASRIREVPSERIRLELERTLALRDVRCALILLEDLGIWPDLWLGGGAQPTPSSRAQADLMSAFEMSRQVEAQLIDETDLYLVHAAIPLLVIELRFLQPCEESTRAFLAAGFITKKQADRLNRILSWRRVPEAVGEQRWFLHRFGRLWPAAACVLATRQFIETGQRPDSDLLTALQTLAQQAAAEVFDPRPLVSGTDLKEYFGLQDSPRLGRILDLLERQQIEGTIQTRAEALELGRRMIRDEKGEGAT